MGDFVSLSEFKEVVSQLVQGGLVDPRRGRLTDIHPSAELFTASGDHIVGLKVKFYIEDPLISNVLKAIVDLALLPNLK